MRTLFIVALAVRLAAAVAAFAAPRALALRQYSAAASDCHSVWQYVNRRPQCGGLLAEDETAYDALGRSLAAGRGFVMDQGWLYTRPGEQTAYANFLYPAFVGAVYWGTRESVLALTLVQVLLGALAVVGVSAAAARLGGAPAGTWAGVLAAVHPGLALSSVMVMTEALAVPLLVGAALTWMRFLERPGWVRGGMVGVACAAACLTRSQALYALPAMLLAAMMGPSGIARRSPRYLLATAAAFLVLMAPWTAYNAARFGVFVLGDTKAGGSLWLNNHPSSNPFREVWEGAPSANPPPAPVPGLNEAQADRLFRKMALSYMWRNPLTTAEVSGLRLGLFLVPLPRYWHLPVLKVLVSAFYVAVTWLGIAGLWRARDDPRARSLAWLGLTWVVLLSLTAMGLRHRLSIEWVLVAGAGMVLGRLSLPGGRGAGIESTVDASVHSTSAIRPA